MEKKYEERNLLIRANVSRDSEFLRKVVLFKISFVSASFRKKKIKNTLFVFKLHFIKRPVLCCEEDLLVGIVVFVAFLTW